MYIYIYHHTHYIYIYTYDICRMIYIYILHQSLACLCVVMSICNWGAQRAAPHGAPMHVKDPCWG